MAVWRNKCKFVAESNQIKNELNDKGMQITSKEDFNEMFKITINGKSVSIDDLGSNQKISMVINRVNGYLRSNLPNLPVPYTLSMKIEDMSIKIYYK